MACDCQNENVVSCGNPCAVSVVNTAACETLPSQIENFTKQFFGEVTKSEVNGQVSWILPCSLDIGLTNNPRAEDEGLACYFLRLFREGIIGLTGPQGATGAAGTNGNNAYTVTTQSFVQPTLASPNVTVKTSANPAILPGLEVFIGSAGWFTVNTVSADGTLFLTLIQGLSSASGTITAGKLVLPTGPPGRSVIGATGPQGPAGPQGTPGASFTATNGQFSTAAGTNYKLQVTFAELNFVTGLSQVLLPTSGTYLLTAVLPILGLPGVATTDVVAFRFRNSTAGFTIAESEQRKSNLINGENNQVVLSVIYTSSGDNQTIKVQGSCTTADMVEVVAARTVVHFVKLSS